MESIKCKVFPPKQENVEMKQESTEGSSSSSIKPKNLETESLVPSSMEDVEPLIPIKAESSVKTELPAVAIGSVATSSAIDMEEETQG
ncbi:unnamed protein product [Arabis nemorensis]|uniref:Uncharacterized protein n=1 Tax=Arabis nemorensis TaxID=586526 RepID=A0A565BHQ7_9BRAS|nr:unnamed protein product [Arabis nemorensis]